MQIILKLEFGLPCAEKNGVCEEGSADYLKGTWFVQNKQGTADNSESAFRL